MTHPVGDEGIISYLNPNQPDKKNAVIIRRCGCVVIEVPGHAEMHLSLREYDALRNAARFQHDDEKPEAPEVVVMQTPPPDPKKDGAHTDVVPPTSQQKTGSA